MSFSGSRLALPSHSPFHPIPFHSIPRLKASCMGTHERPHPPSPISIPNPIPSCEVVVEGGEGVWWKTGWGVS